MDTLSPLTLDPVLHQPVRTRIMAFISTRGETSFTELKRALDITDGNLEAHMKKLMAEKYIRVRREDGKGRPQSIYRLTARGNTAFQHYVDILQRLLKFEN